MTFTLSSCSSIERDQLCGAHARDDAEDIFAEIDEVGVQGKGELLDVGE